MKKYKNGFSNPKIARQAGKKSKRSLSKATIQKKSIIEQFAKMTESKKFQDKFQREFEQLEGKDFFITVTTLLEFIKPKLARVDTKVTGTTQKKVIYEVRYVGNNSKADSSN